WVDWLLGFSEAQPLPWADRYSAKLVENTAALERLMKQAKAQEETARLLAGFCWKWSNPAASGELVDDVVIGEWRRPWNRKAEEKAYKPDEHPYTKWAETQKGESQVGCIYSAQGIDVARAGVVMGAD